MLAVPEVHSYYREKSTSFLNL